MIQQFSLNYLELTDKETIYLSAAQAKHFGIKQNKYAGIFNKKTTVSITLASMHLTLKALIKNNHVLEFNKLYFSADLKNLISIPQGTSLQVKIIGHNHLELGPLVGVFISAGKVASLIKGKIDSVYQHFSKTAQRQGGQCCFFSIGDIDWEKKLVKALLLNNSNTVSRIMPLPKIIYDRCFGKQSRRHGLELRRRSKNGDNRIINNIAKLGKWETFQALRQYPEMLKYLPGTEVYRFNTDIDDALEKFKDIYFKPNLLYKGKGVFRLKKEPGGSYVVKYRNEETNKNEVVYLPNRTHLDELMHNYLEIGWGYIIQETIQLALYKGYPFDFRLLFQKDWQGLWQPSGIVARIAAPGSIITSPRSGGAVEDFSTVLKEVFNEGPLQSSGLYKKIIKIGRKMVECMENEFGDCVELGLDMGLDANGNIWLIEINGKPLKVSLKRLNDTAVYRRCNSQPIEYAVYLSGFQSIDTTSGGN